MPKLYAIQMTMFVRAIDETQAKGLAELNSFSTTQSLRRANSGWVEDKTTMLVRSGEPVVVNGLPKSSYCKKTLIEAYGEERAIKFLNYSVHEIHGNL